MKTVKHILMVISCFFVAASAQAAEPKNNLGRTFSYIKTEWQDLRFVKNNNGREVWGVTEEGNSFIFTFENGVVVEECMMIESNDGFAREWYNAMLQSFQKTSYRSVKRTSDGYTFHYSYFDIKVMYFSDYTGNTAMLLYTTDF